MIRAKVTQSFVRVLWGDPVWAFAGGLIGVLITAGGLYLGDRQDRIGTVVDMQGYLVTQDASTVVIHVTGQKIMPCLYLGVQGFMRAADGLLYEARAVRVDLEETGDTKPVGFFDIGDWRLHKRQGAEAALLFVNHNCGGYLRFSKIADVLLCKKEVSTSSAGNEPRSPLPPCTLQ